MTDNVKALNLYTADMANGYINEADEAITTGAKNGLKIEDNGKTTELGYQLGADFNDPQWDAPAGSADCGRDGKPVCQRLRRSG